MKFTRNFFIDPEDKEVKETINNARKKLETPMTPAMPSSNLSPLLNCAKLKFVSYTSSQLEQTYDLPKCTIVPPDDF